MKRIHFAVAVLAYSLGTAAFALPTTASYSIAATSQSTSTGGTGTANGTSWNDTSASAYGTGGTNYGNTYTWNTATAGTGPKVTMSAWGTTSLSTASTIQKAWVADYGANGFGITSQSSGELNTSHDPDASSPNYQHGIDDVSAYESLMFSFSSAVLMNSISIGFKGTDADATVLEYTGAGDPTTALLAGQSYASLLTSGWKIVGNLLNMSTAGPNALNTAGAVASKYWMVGAYLPIGANGPADAFNDAFKLSAFTTTLAVPEPGSVALLGIAGVALAVTRRRRRG
jgi:hypothetical protein